MKVAIIGKVGAWYTKSLQSAFQLRDVEVPCFPITWLTSSLGTQTKLAVAKESLKDYDAVIIRAIPGGSLEQVIYRVDALHCLENSGVRVINSPSAIEHGVDKYYTLALMQGEGIPVPRTIVTEQFDDAMDAFDELGGDVVVKPLFGSEGRGMTRVSDRDIAYRIFRSLEQSRYVYYLQEYVSHGFEDIRVFVIDGKAVAAMTRRGTSWKCNICNGASGEKMILNEQLKDMSVRAVKALGAVYGGVDFLPLENGGYQLIEVNTIPGWKGLHKATGYDAAGALADYVLGRTA
jgi:RimK family alpha-L-glutamate ligase